MPKEYKACVASEVKSGKSMKVAQRMCAIRYLNVHGKSVVTAAKEKGEKLDGDFDFVKDEAYLTDLTKADLSMGVDFEKVEAGPKDECFVSGYMTTDREDAQGEVVELDASFAAAEEWAKWGNVREMHQPSAVGVKVLMEKHENKGVFLKAEIVDPVAKEKVRKGVYKAFSIGGKVLERMGNRIKKYRMLEVSLVDRPANWDSRFVVAKYDDVSDTEANTGENIETQEPPAAPPATGPSEMDTLKAELKKMQDERVAKDAELKKMQEKTAELEKIASEKKKEDEAKSMFIKMIDELKPELKKQLIESAQNQPTQQELLEAALKQASVGELTSLMLRRPEANKGSVAPKGA